MSLSLLRADRSHSIALKALESGCHLLGMTRIGKSALSPWGGVERITVPCLTLDDILKDCEKSIDFISIDVEGAELEVLLGFDIEKFQPRVLVIEHHADEKDSAVKSLLAAYGYVDKLRVGSNTFYTRADDKGIFKW